MHDHLARVPVPPAEVNPAVPGALSRIILHLLEKDPDHRYQSADGLVHDLERLRDADAQAADALRIGEHDLPPLLLPPSRLVGRDAEVAALQAAFEDARAGRCRAVLVGGAPGVGKTALVDQLRPVVTGSDGWFVAGKFDQYRRDLEFDGVAQAFRALGRLLLAEPEDELAAVRERLLAALGPNAGLITAVIPEFATLLAVPPDPGDPLTAQIRTQRNAVEVLRAVASRKRPVVVFVDDLQWAGRTPLGLFDLVLSEEPVEGLLLVGAYREGDVDAAHPLAALLARAPDQAGVRHLRLDNLPVPASVAMVVEVLHVDRTAAADLVGGDRAAHAGQSVRHTGAAQRAAPRRRPDRGGRGVAVGACRPSRPPRPLRAGPAADGAGRGPAAASAGGGRRDGLPGWPRSTWACCRPPSASRAMWTTGCSRPPWKRGCWWWSPERIRQCGSATIAFATRSCTTWTRNGDAACSWRWRGGWPACRSCSRSLRSCTSRWSTPSTTPRSAVRRCGCCAGPPTRRG